MKSPRYIDGRRGLDDADKKRIEELVEQQPGIKASKVARILKRDVGTVHWHMMNRGMLNLVLKYGREEPYFRGKMPIYPYTRAEDLRLLELRRQGLIPRVIAEVMVKEFGKPRSGHGCEVRIKMLVAYENSPEEISA